MWDTFIHKTVKFSRKCIKERSIFRNEVTASELLGNIEVSRGARLPSDANRYMGLLLRTGTIHKRDKKSHVRGHAEDAEGCLNENEH